eukprot:2145061-Rhodomonas_salina.3
MDPSTKTSKSSRYQIRGVLIIKFGWHKKRILPEAGTKKTRADTLVYHGLCTISDGQGTSTIWQFPTFR